MKRKFVKILGVVLTLSLLVSLGLIPATTVSAGTQAWSTFAIPSATGLVLDTGSTWAGPFAMNNTGTAIYMGGENTAAAGTGALYKSVDGGRTWTKLTIAGLPNALSWAVTVTDIVCSSVDADTVYVTDGYDIYKTTNGGTTWVVLSNLFGSLGILTPLAADAFTMTATGVGADSFTMTATVVGTVTVAATSGSKWEALLLL
jgi:photosystem II stability/assembly factor-like uncharacterized protein